MKKVMLIGALVVGAITFTSATLLNSNEVIENVETTGSQFKLINDTSEKVKVHTHGFNDHTCIDSIGAVDGCSMIKLGYTPKCKCKKGDPFSGSTSYITSNLSQSLTIEKLYKVTYWTYYSEKLARQKVQIITQIVLV